MSGLAFILIGFGIVIAVLSFLWLVCFVVGWFHRDKSRPSPVSSEQPGPAESPIPSAHLAAISAAVSVLLPGRYRIVRVYAPGHKAFGWAEEGRYQISTSHRVRWDWSVPGPLDPIKRNRKPKKRENNP